MNVIFDLDGVLVDTREAVRQAYKDAGVDMPPEKWGQPWHMWLPDLVGSVEKARKVHETKDMEYEKLIYQGVVEKLPPLELLRVLKSSDICDVGILTGASRTAALQIMNHFHIFDVALYGTSMTATGKFEALAGVAPYGVYIDDQTIGVPPGWRLVKFDTPNETMSELMEDLWTP